LGSGDAFGSGGRFQTCIFVQAPETSFVIDCGASSLVAMRRFGVAPDSIDTILLTHLHGDHFGGVPFYLLEAQYVSHRQRPLLIAGPPGTQARLHAAQKLLFPGADEFTPAFEVQIRELPAGTVTELGPVSVRPSAANHQAGDPAYSLRVAAGGKTVTYTGDTAWTEALIPAAKDADLFITECNAFEKRIPYHLDYRTYEAHRSELAPARTVITHMGMEMLAASPNLAGEFAEDGYRIEL
jgi:ribonuclease BN (tRNA processing enzyme)